MKSGSRALGIAESARDDRSVLAGVVVRGDRAVDGVRFSTCTIGGTDVTESILTIFRRFDREDVHVISIAGIALAWYNVVDIDAIHQSTGIPTCSVSFESSTGLEGDIRREFGEGHRLEIYQQLPDREKFVVNGEEIFVRSVGLEEDETREFLETFTPTGGRPEPLRVARLTAYGAADVFL
ncbi:MAG: DUF99 family protein [Halobacteriaceae archaeon]